MKVVAALLLLAVVARRWAERTEELQARREQARAPEGEKPYWRDTVRSLRFEPAP